jgi:hypothetical protein
MPPARFEPTISAGERPQTYTLDGVATGIGSSTNTVLEKIPYYRRAETSDTSFTDSYTNETFLWRN